MHSPEINQESRGRLVAEAEVLIQRFSNYLQALQKSPRTQAEYVKVIRSWFLWWMKPLQAFDTLAWDEWMYHSTERGVKGVTIRMYQSALRKFYKFLRRQKVVAHDPSQDAEAVGIIKRVPEFLTEPQIEAMYAAAVPSKRDTAILELLYGCGLRNTELRDLPAENIMPTQIRVMGKGRKERLVDILPSIYASLSAWLALGKSGVYALGRRGGSKIGMKTVQGIVRRLAKAAGITKRVTPHTLRHSIATHLLARRCDLAFIQEFLGHGSIETTRIYTHVVHNQVAEAVLKAHPRANIQRT